MKNIARNIFLKIAVAAPFQKEKIKGKLLWGLLILFYSIGAKDTRQGGRIMVYFEKQEKERIEMKMISWNVNGLRAAVGKGFLDYFKEADADIFSVLELCGKERLFRCGGIHQTGTHFCFLRLGH